MFSPSSAVHYQTHPTANNLARLDQSCFSSPWDSAEYQRLLDQPSYGCRILMDTQSDSGIGLLCFRKIREEVELHRVGITPIHQKRGWGLVIIQHFMQEMAESAACNIFLEVRTGNIPARRLYEKAGFEQINLRKSYYRNPTEDALNYAFDLKLRD